MLANRRALRGRRGRHAALLRQGGEILLAALQRSDFLAGPVLEIHGKKQRPDHQASHAGGYILTDLEALLGRELTDFWLLASISAVIAVQSAYLSCG
jgi:hypothetical protein